MVFSNYKQEIVAELNNSQPQCVTTALIVRKSVYILMTIHRYITIFDISIQPKCVSIQYHCLMYHDMTIYQYIVASLLHSDTQLCEYKQQHTAVMQLYELILHYTLSSHSSCCSVVTMQRNGQAITSIQRDLTSTTHACRKYNAI